MIKYEQIVKDIDNYEKKRLEEDWFIHYYDLWRDVLLSDILSDIDRYGLNEKSFDTKTEICQRVISYFTFGFEEEPEDRDRLHKTYDALSVLDNHLKHHIGLVDLTFGDKTPDDIADAWEEEERESERQKAQQECIDFCAKVALNDGLCETEEEAYELAEMCCTI